MKRLSIAALVAVVSLAARDLRAQEPEAPLSTESTITARSTLVLVPALVKTKKGAIVYTLKADDFTLTDDGVERKLTLEEDTDHQALALVIAVETGAGGLSHLDDYDHLAAVLDALVGNVPHRVAVVAFDSTPHLVQRFTQDTDRVADILGRLDEGDGKAAILDALGYSVDLLRKQPPNYRRAILLLSETVDKGSRMKLEPALRAISDTNTIIYSIGFSTTRSEISKEASNLSSSDPGPADGCFSRDPNDPNVNLEESRGSQYLNCLSMLAPPLRLVKMAAIAIMHAMQRNMPETVARLTGGEYFSFHDKRTLERDLMTISNHVPNRYVLSFHPQSPHPGPHVVELSLKNYTNLTVEARRSYWVDADPPPDKP